VGRVVEELQGHRPAHAAAIGVAAGGLVLLEIVKRLLDLREAFRAQLLHVRDDVERPARAGHADADRRQAEPEHAGQVHELQ
jgi:hypothetical protein